MRFVLWRAGWLLKNQGQMRCINDWIVQWRRHRYHRWWQLIPLWVNVLSIKGTVITGIVLWRSGWLLINRGHLRWIDDWIIQCRRNRYHWWWQLIALLVTVLAIGAPVIMRSCLLPTLIVPCSTFVATANTLWTWHDDCNMSLWWWCVTFILFVYGRQKVRADFLAWQLQSFLSFITSNRELFVWR